MNKRKCYTTSGTLKYQKITISQHPSLLSYVAAKKSCEVALKAKSHFLILKRSSAIKQCYTTFLVKLGGERDE